MAAATLGAKAAGGKTVAVTFQPRDMPEFEGRYAGNEVDVEIRTANYVERMFGLFEQSDAYICVQGGTGTLSEWATAWLMAHLQYGRHKPLILYGAFWHTVMRTISEHFFIGAKEHEVYRIAENPEEAFLVLQELEQELADRCNLPPAGSKQK
jgi:predicted Rossmann-fold nucleotide-binding protein